MARNNQSFGLLFVFLLLGILLSSASVLAAADTYKPYLHKTSVPKHPEVRLFGQYATELFPGAGTYSFAIELPKGTDGFTPALTLSYNSQNAKGRPGVVGAGWQLVTDSIQRDINSTPASVSDDEYIMTLEKTPYQLIYKNDGMWHTEVEYWFKIENLSTTANTYGAYWQATAKNGIKYIYGNSSSSEVGSNTGQNYAVQWKLDSQQDTHGNRIYYTYSDDPNAEDIGSSYLKKIEYGADNSLSVVLDYEASARSDRRRVYFLGNLLEESRRLTDISVFADGSLVRRYNLGYISLSSSLSAVSSITYYGADNATTLYSISFVYNSPSSGFTNSTQYIPAVIFANTTTEFGVRTFDVNNDGFSDYLKRIAGGDNKVWLNDKQGGFILSSWTVPEDIVLATGVDRGVRFDDVNNDGFVDMIKSQNSVRFVSLNNGCGWVNSSNWTFPLDIVDSSGVDQGVQLADINGDGKVDVFDFNLLMINWTL